MATISANTLLTAIQAVDAALGELSDLHDELTGTPDAKDVQELLISYSHAAKELEAAYEEEQAKTGHLPPYSELVRPKH